MHLWDSLQAEQQMQIWGQGGRWPWGWSAVDQGRVGWEVGRLQVRLERLHRETAAAWGESVTGISWVEEARRAACTGPAAELSSLDVHSTWDEKP